MKPLLSIGLSFFLICAHAFSSEPPISDLEGSDLHHAVLQNNLDECQRLIKSGADVNSVDQDLNTPLHIIANMIAEDHPIDFKDTLKIAQILLVNKIDVKAKNRDKMSALILVASRYVLASKQALRSQQSLFQQYVRYTKFLEFCGLLVYADDSETLALARKIRQRFPYFKKARYFVPNLSRLPSKLLPAMNQQETLERIEIERQRLVLAEEERNIRPI